MQAFTAPEVPKDLPKEIKKNKNFLRKISLGTLGSLGMNPEDEGRWENLSLSSLTSLEILFEKYYYLLIKSEELSDNDFTYLNT